MQAKHDASMRAQAAVGRKVMELRKKRGWSRDQLGQFLGHTGESVRQIEAGKQMPRWDTIMRLAATFGVGTSEFEAPGWQSDFHPLRLVEQLMEPTELAKPSLATRKKGKSSGQRRYQPKRRTGRKSSKMYLETTASQQHLPAA